MRHFLVLLFFLGLAASSFAGVAVNGTSAESVTVSVANVTTIKNGTAVPKARSLFRSDLPRPLEVSLAFVAHEIGMLECAGVDHLTGGNFFENYIGIPGADFGGNYLCQPTCGGDCVPNQELGVAPSSLYPFGCKCNVNRCNAEGPIITQFVTGRFKVVCVRDTRCTCAGMGSDVPHEGYLCNWLNLSSHRFVTFLDRHPINPTYSPIRWCSCCPQVPQYVPAPY